MGEYFEDANPKTEGDEDEKLITNFNSLCSAYNALVDKIQTITNEGYEAIMPIRTELTGSKKTPDDIGQVGKLRRKIEMSRIWRMEIGMEMYSTLKNIEDLDRWSERYIKYIEDNMDALKLICKSAFKIIMNLHIEGDNRNAKILRMEDQIVMITGVPLPKEIKKRDEGELKDAIKPVEAESIKEPELEKEPELQSQLMSNEPEQDAPESEQVSEDEPKSEPIDDGAPELEGKERYEKYKKTADEKRHNILINAPPDDRFKKLLNEKLAGYIEAEKTDDKLKIRKAKMQLFGLCGLSIPKRKFVEEEFNKIALKKV